MALNRRTLLISALALPLAGTLPALASAPAEDYVHQLGVEVLRLAAGGHRGDKALQRRFANLLNRYINIPGVAAFALGPAKANLPDGQKGQFYELVANYAAALFVWYVADFQGSDLKITNSSEQGKFTTVDSAIAGNGDSGFRYCGMAVASCYGGRLTNAHFSGLLRRRRIGRRHSAHGR